MSNLLRVLLLGFSVLVGVLLWPGAGIAFDRHEGRDSLPHSDKPINFDPRTSRSIAFDNDVLVPGSRDQDYTYGLNLAFTGSGVEDQWASLHQPLDWLDKGIGLDRRISNGIESSKIEYGLFGFMPDELNHGIVEAWVDYTVALAEGYSFTYSIRGHTSELKQGVGDRNVLWGGLQITKSFD